MKALAALTLSLLLLLTGCSSDENKQQQWDEDEVSFDADGLIIHGTYRHQKDADPGPAALLISESGNTDRNGDTHIAEFRASSNPDVADPSSERLLLFVRQHKSDPFGTSPYLFAGPATFVEHRGDRPIAITWQLDHALPSDFFAAASVAAG